MSAHIFYHWTGYNRILFDKVQEIITNPTVLLALNAVSNLLSYKLVCIHMAVVFACMLYTSKKYGKTFKLEYANALCTTALAICIYYPTVVAIKPFFSMIRPICANDIFINSIIPALSKKMPHECYKSFPSGHTGYVATFIFGMWGALNMRTKIIGILLVFLMMLARIAKGAHFPVDVTYGAFFGMLFAFTAHQLCKSKIAVQHIAKFKKLVDGKVMPKL